MNFLFVIGLVLYCSLPTNGNDNLPKLDLQSRHVGGFVEKLKNADDITGEGRYFDLLPNGMFTEEDSSGGKRLRLHERITISVYITYSCNCVDSINARVCKADVTNSSFLDNIFLFRD